MAISVYRLKPAFVALLLPIAGWAYSLSVTANQVTSVTACLSLLYGGILCLFPSSFLLWLALPCWLFLRMALNAIDGILAHEYGQKTRFGGIFCASWFARGICLVAWYALYAGCG